MLRGWRRLFAALVAAALCSSMATAPATAGGKGGGGRKPSGGTTVGTHNGNFSCRAALARLEGAGLLAGVDKELFVANAPGNPCVTDFAGILASLNVSSSLHHQKMTTTDLLSADVKVLYGQTQLLEDAGYSLPRRGVAEAGVALIRVSVLGIQIEVAVLTAEAAAHCAAGDVAALKGRSKVVGLKIDGVHKDGADGHRHLPGQAPRHPPVRRPADLAGGQGLLRPPVHRGRARRHAAPASPCTSTTRTW